MQPLPYNESLEQLAVKENIVDTQKTVRIAALATYSRNRAIAWFSLRAFNHWILIFLVLFGIYWVTPFFAPVFMRLGWTGAATVIYTIYSTQCHQMAQRSIFLFGPQPMYNIAQLPITMTNNEAVDMLALRAFVGNQQLGWKVAWSDRMVYMYGGVWFTAFVLALARYRYYLRPLRLQTVILLLVPMGIDGGTHFISDIMGGLSSGFRYDNQWLATLTGHVLPAWFYVGDSFGSFNSMARLVSGILFGAAVAGLFIPYMDSLARESAEILRQKRIATHAQTVGPIS